MKRLPPIRSLEAFIAAAEAGSLVAAADKLHISVPAISRRLTSLEQTLGFALFERHARGVSLTEGGAVYHDQVAQGLKMLRHAHSTIDASREQTVRLTTIPAFANRWLLPRLPRFTEAHPDIEIEWVTSTAYQSLEEDRLDLAIRLSRDDAMCGEPLLPIHVCPVWRPQEINRPITPEYLHNYRLLDPDHRPEFWDEWLTAHGLHEREFVRRIVDPLLLYEMAASGSGVAIGIEPLVADLIVQGRLAAMSTHKIRSERSFYLLQSRNARPATRLLIDWLKTEARW